jgi:TonB-dependent starch-binding outer membrane protein SusC
MYVSVQQTLRAMQLTAFLLTACCLTVSAGTLSQSTITFSGKDVKLETVFSAVKKQTGYYFVYNKEIINKAPLITINANNLPLQEFMEMVLRGQELEWVLQKTTILIQKKKQEEKKQVADKPLPVTGVVRGPEGQPVVGANIMIKGTKRGTVTDEEGKFRIDADEGNVLEISAIGFGNKEIKLNGSQQINVALEIASSILDEVQYIAYGQTSKRLSTGNITSVKATDIEKQPVQNVLLALQARVPGLFVTQPSGISGTAVKVRIQGQNSIANGNDPLYVVDGVPIDAQLPRTGVDAVLGSPGSGAGSNNFGGFGSPLSYLNPSDIESIDVLKDGDATAIYGSRAANGAILITTKKGKAGDMKLDLNVQRGIARLARRLNMMNTRQYLDMRYEAFRNDNIDWRSSSVSANDLKVWDTASYTDWQKELLGGNAHYTNLNASLFGGTNIARYLVSGTYHKETTVFPFPDFADQKAAVHFNMNANSSNQKFRMQFSGNLMFDENRLPLKDITQTALLREPNAPPLLNADGSINWAPDGNGNTTVAGSDGNVMVQKLQRYVNKTYNLLNSLKLEYNLLPGLNLGSSFGYTYMQTNDYILQPLIAVAPELRASTQRSANFGDRNIQSWIIEPQMNYRTMISRGVLDLIIGSTFQEKIASSNFFTGVGQLSDNLLSNINSAASITKGGGSYSNYRYSALFARANYNWSDKYIVNINARRDGSTRFGADNRFHNFGSIGVAWIFSSENFFKPFTDCISFGKIRGSYGSTGSDQIGDYQFMSLYNLSASASVPYQGVVGLYPAGLPNPALQWEETRKQQVGIDLGFFQDKLIFNATFVRNRSSNQLLQYSLPTQAGFDAYLVNFPATIQNKSWEIIVTGKIVQRKNITWTSSVNFTSPKNKLVEFPNIERSTYANFLHVGSPVDVYAYLHWLGVAPGTGEYLFSDRKGNPTIAPSGEDATVLISQFPTAYGGVDNTINYKNFQVSFIFQYVKQIGYNDVALSNGAAFTFPGKFRPGLSNQPVTVLDRWQKPGDVDKTVAKYSNTDPSQAIMNSDRRFSDASFIRLKNVALSWAVPQEWLQKGHLKNLRIYMHGQNLLTVTKYKGLDPETRSMMSLPPLQVWTFGIQLGL